MAGLSLELSPRHNHTHCHRITQFSPWPSCQLRKWVTTMLHGWTTEVTMLPLTRCSTLIKLSLNGRALVGHSANKLVLCYRRQIKRQHHSQCRHKKTRDKPIKTFWWDTTICATMCECDNGSLHAHQLVSWECLYSVWELIHHNTQNRYPGCDK